MATPDASPYHYDGNSTVEQEEAKARLVEGGRLMDKYIAQVKADMGSNVLQGYGQDHANGEVPTPQVIDKDSVKKLSRSELESLAVSLQMANVMQARDIDFAFRVFFQLLHHTRYTTTGRNDIADI